MTLNVGYIEATAYNTDVTVRVYYDTTQTPGDGQSLINGPRGWCLDITNVTGQKASLTLTLPNGNSQTYTLPKGNPVTSGTARSRTAAEMSALGFDTRGDVSGFELDA